MCTLHISVTLIDSLSKIPSDQYDHDMLSRLEHCQKTHDRNAV